MCTQGDPVGAERRAHRQRDTRTLREHDGAPPAASTSRQQDLERGAPGARRLDTPSHSETVMYLPLRNPRSIPVFGVVSTLLLVGACRASGAPLTLQGSARRTPHRRRMRAARFRPRRTLLAPSEEFDGVGATSRTRTSGAARSRAPADSGRGLLVAHTSSLSLGAQLIATVNARACESIPTRSGRRPRSIWKTISTSRKACSPGASTPIGAWANGTSSTSAAIRPPALGLARSTRNIQIRDTVFPVNTTVSTDFETVVKLLSLQLPLSRALALGASFGVHWMDMRAPNGRAGGAVLEQDLTITAPCRVLGSARVPALPAQLFTRRRVRVLQLPSTALQHS